jgi:hypothetical protein
MKKRRKVIVEIITFLFPLLLFGMAYIQIKNHNNELNKYGKYTISYTYGTYKAGGVYKVKCYYFVNGVRYNRGFSKNLDTKIPGRYYLKYSTNNPETSEIYLDKPVPSRIKDVPPEGWDKIPKYYQSDDVLPNQKKWGF